MSFENWERFLEDTLERLKNDSGENRAKAEEGASKNDRQANEETGATIAHADAHISPQPRRTNNFPHKATKRHPSIRP